MSWLHWHLREILSVPISLALGSGAIAAPPPNADPTLAPWFRSLQTKDGKSCCGEADCRRFPVHINGDHYWILYNGGWVVVPDEAVDHKRMDNPTGDYVACVVQNRQPVFVLCFFLRPGA
jgi:hypothetical protein